MYSEINFQRVIFVKYSSLILPNESSQQTYEGRHLYILYQKKKPIVSIGGLFLQVIKNY